MPLDGTVKIQQKVDSVEDRLDNALDYYTNNGRSHFFSSENHGHLHIKFFENAKSKELIVISPGRSESTVKYAEMIYELKDKNVDILVIDHRGQGFSSRLCHCPRRGHVQKFQDYFSDLEIATLWAKEKKEYRKVILLAHSMGSLIGLGAQIKNKSLFDAMVISSPMLKIKTKGVPNFVAKFLALGFLLIGKGEKVVYEAVEDEDLFNINDQTNCSSRFSFHQKLKRSYPQIKHGPPTVQWLFESLKATRFIWKKRKELSCPILLLQAGNDLLVDNKRQDQFSLQIPNCRIIRLKNAKHEIIQEKEEIRSLAMVQINTFISEIFDKRSSKK